MKFLADESIEAPVIGALRSEGMELTAIDELAPGSEDPAVLKLAETENRILLTNDKDFADLAFLQRKATSGIVLVRMGRFRSAAKSRRLLEVIRDQGDRLVGAMTVVEAHAIRRRSFPR
ncbi:MAG: DUF5615 family PIN-like protein [Planctomycetota bacterium]